MASTLASEEQIHVSFEPVGETTGGGGCMRLFHKQEAQSASSGLSRSGNGASASSLADVIETDYLQDWSCSQDSLADDDNSNIHNSDQQSKDVLTDSEANLSYGTFEEELDKQRWTNLLRIMTESLRTTLFVRGRRCNVVVSQELLEKISADIIRMSQNEPLGVNGCSIEVRLERVGVINHLCELRYDTDSECMFKIIVSLKEDEKQWYDINNLVAQIHSMLCCRHGLLHFWVYIGRAYKLEKIKLYAMHPLSR